MRKINIIIGVLLFFILGLFSLSFSQGESMTITTYYPSPYGSYNELQLYPHSTPSTSCNSTTRGTMYYDSDDDQTYVCNGSSWVTLGAGYWAASPANPNNIYNTNIGNVGIGTINPRAHLEIFDLSGASIRVGQNINAGFEYSRGSGDFYLGGDSGQAGNFYIKNSTGTTTVAINSDNPSYFNGGNVGIGTASPRSTFQVVGNYVQIPTITGSYPPPGDCNESAEAGRMVVRTDGGVGLRLWVCAGRWISFQEF